MYRIFFIQSSIIGRPGRFRILTIVSNAAVDIGVHRSFQISVCVFFGKEKEEELLDSKVVLFLTFKFLRPLRPVSHSGRTSLQFHQQCTRSRSSTSAPALGGSGLPDDSCLYRCEATSHGGFDSHFPDAFRVPVGHVSVLFGETSLHVLPML